jgi:hypothetical protein
MGLLLMCPAFSAQEKKAFRWRALARIIHVNEKGFMSATP